MFEFCRITMASATVEQWHALLKLRSEVFVLEQQCAYADADDTDALATHLLAYSQGNVVACARLFKTDVWHIGRVATAAKFRNRGIANSLMKECLNDVAQQGGGEIKLSAQAHLIGYYRRFGFEANPPLYLEDGIPHCAMGRFVEARFENALNNF